MTQLRVPFARSWDVRLPVMIRYFDRCFVDEFFETGKLKLSSFKVFRNHRDEERRDEMEGRVTAELARPNGRLAVLAMNGQAAFVLCGSSVESEEMSATFSADAGLRIIDTLAFADAVSRHIPGFIGGMQGNCIYREDTTLRKRLHEPARPAATGEDPEHLRFAKQNEYRLIWFAQSKECDELFVTCPEAVNFCQRLRHAT